MVRRSRCARQRAFLSRTARRLYRSTSAVDRRSTPAAPPALEVVGGLELRPEASQARLAIQLAALPAAAGSVARASADSPGVVELAGAARECARFPTRDQARR